jgi:DNA-binding transcriptional ArsR family regulator
MNWGNFFQALGHPTRIEIVAILIDQTATAGDLAAMLELTAPHLRYHLDLLVEAGVVTADQPGRGARYVVRDEVRPILEAARIQLRS